MKQTLPMILLMAAVATAPADAADAKQQAMVAVAAAPEAWTMFGRDLQNTNHYPRVTGSSYRKLWSTRAGCPAPGMSSTLVDDHAMYNTSPCSNTGDTHAVGLDGKLLWSHGVGEGKRGIISTPCLHDGTLYCVDNGVIKALGARDGAMRWQVAVTCGKLSLSSPIVYDGKLYLNGDGGVQILPLDRTSSDEDKLLPIAEGNGASTPAFSNGTMVVQSLRRVHAYDTKTLQPRWQAELPLALRERLVQSPVIDVQQGRVFVASSMPYDPKGQLWCLNLADGSEVWRQDTEGVSIRPALTFDGKRLYLASLSGKITAYDAGSGKAEWVWSLPGETETADGKLDFRRQLGGLISSKNKLVFCNSDRLFIISSDKPAGIDFQVDLGGFCSPTPAFHHNDLFFRLRTKDQGARNERYTEVKETPAADLDVQLIHKKAQIRNLTASKLVFFQFCFGINVNEKQNCVPCDFELQPGATTELDLERFLSVDKDIHHLLLCLEYEKPGGDGEFHHYFTLDPNAAE